MRLLAGDVNATILVAEDDPVVAKVVTDLLEVRGYRVRSTRTAAETEALAAEARPDLILLDLKLPDGGGLALCADLKARCDAPIIICSATKRKEDAIVGLRLGAEDFVAKPFNPAELLARIEAALRRAAPVGKTEPSAQAPRQQLGGLVIDDALCRATLEGKPLSLTPTEYKLLRALASRPGAVVGREELADSVWGYHDYAVGRSLDVHMRRLRGKLNASGTTAPALLTARGFGYRLVGARGKAAR